MDAHSRELLAHLITTERVAALGTLRSGAPFVSMVLFAPARDFTAYYLHISRLAHHTQDLLQDPRVSLMISETDVAQRDPQTLARISLLGVAQELPRSADEYGDATGAYLAKYPQTAGNFRLGDFSIYRIQVHSARYVANFGKIFNLRLASLRRTAGIDSADDNE